MGGGKQHSFARLRYCLWEKSMNKADLISHVATSAELNKMTASAAVEAVLDGITSTLQNGDSVSLVGFGTFSVAERAARTARNPRTGEPIEVGPSKAPKFKAGKALKDAVK
ncbi:MAG: HU family DNA-binding protein [Mariprofundaceae bacterium]|nr:HU family DNA-binding protein [Mariprofundaceae bacterium]